MGSVTVPRALKSRGIPVPTLRLCPILIRVEDQILTPDILVLFNFKCQFRVYPNASQISISWRLYPLNRW